MTVITTHLKVAPDGAISSERPLPAGEHVARIEIGERPAPAVSAFELASLPLHDLGAWPKGVSLRREDLYGDDGR